MGLLFLERIMKKKIITILFLYAIVSTPFKPAAFALEPSSVLSGIAQIGMAFMTNLAVHESGHAAAASYVGADGISLNFFTKKGGKFFLGLSNVENIDKKSRLPYSLGGEVGANLTFEYALQRYRGEPTLYNKSLIFFSGTDFLWYSIYAFYLTDGDPSYDPIIISEETGLSKNIIFSVALAQTMINAYRVYSGQDRVVPYLSLDKYSAIFNLRFTF